MMDDLSPRAVQGRIRKGLSSTAVLQPQTMIRVHSVWPIRSETLSHETYHWYARYRQERLLPLQGTWMHLASS